MNFWTLVIILYSISILIAFGVILYFYDDSDDNFAFFASLFWPLLIITFIVVAPFGLVKKIVKKIKKVKSTPSVNLSKFCEF